MYCPIIGREHKSNHQYICITKTGSQRKCLDPECKDKSNHRIPLTEEIKNIVNTFTEIGEDKIEEMKNECQKIISNFDEECNDINFNNELNRFEGTDSIGFSKFIKG